LSCWRSISFGFVEGGDLLAQRRQRRVNDGIAEGSALLRQSGNGCFQVRAFGHNVLDQNCRL
jgi:hypothetical protein